MFSVILVPRASACAGVYAESFCFITEGILRTIKYIYVHYVHKYRTLTTLMVPKCLTEMTINNAPIRLLSATIRWIAMDFGVPSGQFDF